MRSWKTVCVFTETHSPGPEGSHCWPLTMWVRAKTERLSVALTDGPQSPSHTHTLWEVRVHLEKLWSPSIHQFYYWVVSKERAKTRDARKKWLRREGKDKIEENGEVYVDSAGLCVYASFVLWNEVSKCVCVCVHVCLTLFPGVFPWGNGSHFVLSLPCPLFFPLFACPIMTV